MSTIINLFGGPGSGKTTLSLDICSHYKKKSVAVELVREYVKEWAYEGRKFGKYDQFYFLGKQAKKESMLYGKVDLVVTDSPLLIAGFYAEFINDLKFVTDAAFGFMKEAEKEGHTYLNFFLPRRTKYEAHGRFQNEDDAKKIDDAQRQFLVKNNVAFVDLDVPLDDRLALVLQYINGQDQKRTPVKEGTEGSIA